jgi:hypothetical protein
MTKDLTLIGDWRGVMKLSNELLGCWIMKMVELAEGIAALLTARVGVGWCRG